MAVHGVTLSIFLVYVAVFEAIWGAQAGASAAWIAPQRLDEVLAPLAPDTRRRLAVAVPMHQLYVGEGFLAMAGPTTALETPSAVSYLAKIDGVDWDWASWDAS